VQIWGALTNQHIYTYTGHRAGVNSLIVLHNGPTAQQLTILPTIASASDDGTVHVWRPDGAASVYAGHHGPVNAVAQLSSDAPYYGPRMVSAGEDHAVQVWSATPLKLLNIYREHQAPVRALATSPVWQDTRVASGDAAGLVHVWTVTDPSY